MPIKHIILEGGGYMGLSALGALSELQKEKFYDISNIQSIYATSIGAFIGVMLCLKIDWDIMLDYIKDRPWHKIVTFTPNMILETITKKGIFDISFFRESMRNLLLVADFTIDLTLEELYTHSNIELHICATKLNTMELVEFTGKTHPTMKIIDAIYASSTLPFIFQPLWYENSYYLDGGLVNNYPLDLCIENGGNVDDILGIHYNIMIKDKVLGQDAHLLEYSWFLYKKLFRKLRKVNDIKLINEIIIPCDVISINECKQLLRCASLREKYITHGKKAAQLFFSYMKRK
jgi:predicted acylesterase/phospholipase RssA